MAKKKKKPEEHENHERWLVSYADFITLLFAFFVVMYSVSSVNEGKFRTVSSSIRAALKPIVSPLVTADPIKVGNRKAHQIAPDLNKPLELVYRRLRQNFERLPTEAHIRARTSIIETDRGIVITMQDSVLFEPGRAVVLPDALPFLQAIGEVLSDYDREVKVEGHTDNVPISTDQFPSNWELSALRAVMVARLLTDVYQVNPKRVSAVALSHHRPLTDNSTPEGRAKNRRVEIVVKDEHKKKWTWY